MRILCFCSGHVGAIVTWTRGRRRRNSVICSEQPRLHNEGTLLRFAPGLFTPTSRVPEHRLRASVSLIPKVVNALEVAEFGPITVQPSAHKIAGRMLLNIAERSLYVCRFPSQGYRPSYHAAGIHWSVKHIVQKHQEWGTYLWMMKMTT